jgi:hypothetical protein
MVGITYDVLNHTSILFCKGTVNFRSYKSELLVFYNNSSINVWILLRRFVICYLCIQDFGGET